MKSRKLLIPVVIVLAAIIAAVAVNIIRSDYGSVKYNGELYFFNDSATAIVAENREIKYRDKQGLAESVI